MDIHRPVILAPECLAQTGVSESIPTVVFYRVMKQIDRGIDQHRILILVKITLKNTPALHVGIVGSWRTGAARAENRLVVRSKGDIQHHSHFRYHRVLKGRDVGHLLVKDCRAQLAFCFGIDEIQSHTYIPVLPLYAASHGMGDAEHFPRLSGAGYIPVANLAGRDNTDCSLKLRHLSKFARQRLHQTVAKGLTGDRIAQIGKRQDRQVFLQWCLAELPRAVHPVHYDQNQNQHDRK